MAMEQRGNMSELMETVSTGLCSQVGRRGFVSLKGRGGLQALTWSMQYRSHPPGKQRPQKAVVAG
jgi:hypothetical protein